MKTESARNPGLDHPVVRSIVASGAIAVHVTCRLLGPGRWQVARALGWDGTNMTFPLSASGCEVLTSLPAVRGEFGQWLDDDTKGRLVVLDPKAGIVFITVDPATGEWLPGNPGRAS